jgi:hypothetical protein
LRETVIRYGTKRSDKIVKTEKRLMVKVSTMIPPEVDIFCLEYLLSNNTERDNANKAHPSSSGDKFETKVEEVGRWNLQVSNTKVEGAAHRKSFRNLHRKSFESLAGCQAICILT